MIYARTQKGISLIETLVVIGASTVLLVAMMSAIVFFYHTNAYTIEQALAIASARRGVEKAVKHVREAAYSDEGSYPVISMSANSFSFYSDIDQDNSIEKVRIFLDGLQLKEGITNSAGNPPTYTSQPEAITILSDEVRNTAEATNVFKYYASDGTEVTNYADITSIRFIEITLIVNINPSKLPNEFTLRSSATMRNLQSGF